MGYVNLEMRTAEEKNRKNIGAKAALKDNFKEKAGSIRNEGLKSD